MFNWQVVGVYSDGHVEVLATRVSKPRAEAMVSWLYGACDGARYYVEQV